MCGIAAIFAYHYAAPEVDREELRTVRDFMSSRGPDGSGEWFSEDDRIGLGHRRLAIIDLSEKGAQPMKSKDGKLVISFNGEIYNYKELRGELEKKGRVFQSQSDTEVLLHLYQEKGEAMMQELRGMFAFALWDGNKNVLLLARDPYGIKPLYYADDGWTIRAASQVKALLAGGKVSTLPEPAGIVGFYLLGSVPEPFTTYQEIRQVPAGSIIGVGKTGPLQPKSYFSVAQIFLDASKQNKKLSETETKGKVREILIDTVRHHLVADVPVGAFLSGGVDSGTLIGLASDAGAKDLETVTLAFREFRGGHQDESLLAARTAELYGTKHHSRVLPVDEFQTDLSKFMEAMDQPTIDGINTYFVSKAAREIGLKVVLSGLGGDELFGGYPSFVDIPRSVRAFGFASNIPFLGEIFRHSYSRLNRSRLAMRPKLAGLLKYGGSYEGAYLLRRGVFMPWELSSVLDKEVVIEGLRRLSPLEHIKEKITPDPKTAFGRVAALEAALYMRNQLLRDADWAGMAHSLEIRTPFVDSHLLKSLAPILVCQAASASEPNQKKLLAESLRIQPPAEVTGRPKTGFSVPIEKWLEFEGELDVWRKVPKLAGQGCPWSRRWAYVIMERQKGVAPVLAQTRP